MHGINAECGPYHLLLSSLERPISCLGTRSQMYLKIDLSMSMGDNRLEVIFTPISVITP